MVDARQSLCVEVLGNPGSAFVAYGSHGTVRLDSRRSQYLALVLTQSLLVGRKGHSENVLVDVHLWLVASGVGWHSASMDSWTPSWDWWVGVGL